VWHEWGTREVYTGFWWGNLMERDHLGDLGVDGMMMQEIRLESMDWIALAQDRDKWRALVNGGKETLGSTKCEEFLD
jgi:hypothetical protein